MKSHARPLARKYSPMKDWTPVKSSNIAAMKLETGELFVKFLNGGIYSYADVALTKFEELVGAESVGRAFHKLVKTQADLHPFTKVQ